MGDVSSSLKTKTLVVDPDAVHRAPGLPRDRDLVPGLVAVLARALAPDREARAVAVRSLVTAPSRRASLVRVLRESLAPSQGLIREIVTVPSRVASLSTAIAPNREINLPNVSKQRGTVGIVKFRVRAPSLPRRASRAPGLVLSRALAASLGTNHVRDLLRAPVLVLLAIAVAPAHGEAIVTLIWKMATTAVPSTATNDFKLFFFLRIVFFLFVTVVTP